MNEQHPKLLSMTDAAIYAAREHGVTVTRQTIYNWAKNGKHGVHLTVVRKAGITYTTERAVDEFIAGAN